MGMKSSVLIDMCLDMVIDMFNCIYVDITIDVFTVISMGIWTDMFVERKEEEGGGVDLFLKSNSHNLKGGEQNGDALASCWDMFWMFLEGLGGTMLGRFYECLEGLGR